MQRGAGIKRVAPWLDHPRTWYQLEVWRKRRRYHLLINPVCVMCARKGLAVAATVADHITPHNGDWMQFLTAPLQSLCAQCHNSDKRYLDLNGHARVVFGSDGWPVEGDIAMLTNKQRAGGRVALWASGH